MKYLAAIELVRVVVLVRWEEFAQKSAIDIKKGRQVKREARRYVYT